MDNLTASHIVRAICFLHRMTLASLRVWKKNLVVTLCFIPFIAVFILGGSSFVISFHSDKVTVPNSLRKHLDIADSTSGPRLILVKYIF